MSSEMTPVAISVRQLAKRYRLGTSRASYGRLTESMSDGIARLFKRAKGAPQQRTIEYVWALNDLSFDIHQGEVVGVIGANGAGKTTMLKILSRITEPTKGVARVRGRVGALLEVAAGFHPELTGRENVFLNGAILGMRRAEIQKRFGDIVAFSEVERFIDTPVKRYSSGMFLRLAFAVAAHLEPDVLIVDEVLAVGDAAFQKKCLGRMEDVAGSGRTVLFVSHNMGAIRALCTRALVLESGNLVFDGPTTDAIGAYMARVESLATGGEVTWSAKNSERPSSEELALQRVAVVGPLGRSQGVHETNARVCVEIDYEVLRPISGMRLVMALLTAEGEIAFRTTDHSARGEMDPPGRYRSTATIPANLLNRRNYVVMLSFEVPGFRFVLPPKDYLTFMVAGVGNHGSHFPEPWDGAVSPIIGWKVDRLPARSDQVVQDPVPSMGTDLPAEHPI